MSRQQVLVGPTPASADAEVTLAVRNPGAGERTALDIIATSGNERVRVSPLDLAGQSSIAAFVAAWNGPVHILVELAKVFDKDADRLQDILRSSKPAAERHAEAAGLLWLPVPLLTGHPPEYDGLPTSTSRFSGRRRIRRIRATLGLLQLAALAAIYFFFPCSLRCCSSPLLRYSS